MRVEKDINDEMRSLVQIAEWGKNWMGGPGPQPLGAQLRRREELRTAGNSRESRPS